MGSLWDCAKLDSLRGISLAPGDRLVKVVSAAGRTALHERGFIAGYVTQEKYLYGLNSNEVERALGLRTYELRNWAYIYALGRMPAGDDIDYRLSAAIPAQMFRAADASDPGYEVARRNFHDGVNLYNRSYTPVIDYYPPGSARIPQWEVKESARIPLGVCISILTQITPFTRPDGSTSPYRPHNRLSVIKD